MKKHSFLFDYTKVPKKKLGEYQVAIVNDDSPITIDVGCSVGAFPVMYGHLFSKVFAVDACYTNLRILEKNLQTNNINNCFPFHFAAGEKTGELIQIVNPGASPYNNVSHVEGCLFKSRDSSQGSTQNMDESTVPKDAQYHYAISVSFGDLIRFLGVSKVDFLKVDIEGAEYSFLYEADLSFVDILAIEIHFSKTDKAQELKTRLEKDFSYLSEKEGVHSEYLMVNKRITDRESIKYKEARSDSNMVFEYVGESCCESGER